MAKAPKEFIEKALFVVDASSYIFRAYYAVQSELKAPDGTPTHATHTFVSMIRALIKEYSLERIILAWDRKEKGFRHEIFPEYKANRGAPPEDLSLQLENAQKFMSLMGVPQTSQAGYEADDVIASLVKQKTKENWVIVSPDKDLLQLVDERIWCFDPMRKKWSNEEQSIEKFGVPPIQVPEIQALCGDSVDNIPGAPGIGPKTASQLMKDFGSLEKIISVAEERHKNPPKPKEIKDALKGKKIENIALHKDQIELSLKLVSLETKMDLEDLNFEIKIPSVQDLFNESNRLGFTRLCQELKESHGSELSKTEGALDSSLESEKSTQEFLQIKSAAQFKNLLEEHKEKKLLALDTETFSLKKQESENLVGLCLSFGGDTAYYVPLRHKEEDHNINPSKALKIFQNFLKENKTGLRIVFQNAKFDLHMLASEGIFIPEEVIVEDTMVASFALDPSSKHGLDYLAAQFLNNYTMKSFKEVTEGYSDFSEVPVKEATFYAAEDAWATFKIWEKLEAALKKNQELWKLYEIIDRPLLKILFKMELTGIQLNSEQVLEIARELQKDLDSIDQETRALLTDYNVENVESINFLSPKQIGKVLYEDLELPVLKKKKTGPSTDVSVLEELSLQHPFPAKILEIRELKKLLSTYVQPLPELVNPQTGRIHTTFMQTIAQTGRLASANPNLQNIPIRTERGKKIREAFTAPKGKLFIGADYSQIELRILAHQTQDPSLLEAFSEGKDIHSSTAAKIFSKKESEITSDERRAAKTINFGIVYGQSAYGLSKTLKIPRKEAKKFIDQYFEKFPRIKEYLETSPQEAREKGYSLTLTGRRRPLKDIDSKNPTLRGLAERMAINTPMQGSAADLIKIAMIRLDQRLEKEHPEAKLVLQVHDELIYECPEQEAEKLHKIIKEEMEASDLFKDFGLSKLSSPIEVDSDIGRHWGEI